MLLNNILFISEETLKTESNINLNIDNRLLTDTIKQCQLEFILPILGTALYEDIQNNISANTVSANYQTLLNYYIQPTLIKYATAKALPIIHYQVRNGGVNKLIGDTIEPVQLKELQFVIDTYMNSAQFNAQRLIEYLVQNKGTYTLYSDPNNRLDSIKPVSNNVYDSGMYIPGKNKLSNYNPNSNCCN